MNKLETDLARFVPEGTPWVNNYDPDMHMEHEETLMETKGYMCDVDAIGDR